MNKHYTQFFQLLLPYKRVLFLAIILMFGESILALASPWLAGHFTKAILIESNELVFSYQEILLFWLFVLVAQASFKFGSSYSIGKTSVCILSQLRIILYEHLQALPLSYYHNRKRGSVLTIINYDIEIISDFIIGTVVGLLPQLITLIGALYFIYIIDPFFALLIGILAPLYFIIIKILGRNIRPATRAMLDSYAKTFSIVEENLQLLPIIKTFTREKLESEKISKENAGLQRHTQRFLWMQSKLSPLAHFIAAATILLLLWIGSLRLESGMLSIDQLVSLLMYGMLLTRPVSHLAEVYGEFQHVKGASERLAEVLDIKTELIFTEQDSQKETTGHIEFSNIEFSYEDREKILCGLNLKISAGETVAITGKNGTGKSTIAYLLQRFAEPQEGNILIDKQDISDLGLSNLRQKIGVVSQQVLLLNGTVRENILFGKADASHDEVEAAVKSSQAIDFINELPDGFETVIGDQGVKLSGGQKQRLALARALLKNAPILILDEATAMFDPEGEKSFIEGCHSSLNNRTVILITHRPESLALADRVLELRDGKIH